MTPKTSSSRAARLDRASALPLFAQLKQWLLAEIAGWPDPARRFHTEAEIAARFSVSRHTVRRAIADLVRAGLLARSRGAGSHVQQPRLAETIDSRMDVRGDWRALGVAMAIRVLDFARQAAGPAFAAELGVAPGAEIRAIRRLRLVAGVPVALDERILPLDVAARAKLTRRSAAGSIIDALRRAGLTASAEWHIDAVRADAEEQAILQIDAGAPLLVRRMRYLDQNGRCILAGRSIHRGDLMSFVVRLPLDRDLGNRVDWFTRQRG
ncbi:MAG: GntR family transcriptional regulator [Alphaproteobacteria bacterium]|nr:GntR family transcriptional regulator [Alphaproteobacteria bacterium]